MTTKGRNKGRHQKWQQGLSQQTPNPQQPNPREGESSIERSLANVKEAHQKALVTVAALEEEIEQLSCPLIRSQPEVKTHSRSRDHQIHGSRGGRGGATRHGLRTAQPPTSNITPPEGTRSLAEK